MKCYAPWHSILVRFNGDIVPDPVYTERYGNLFKNNLKEILNSKVAKETKETLRNGVLPEECGQCEKKEAVIGHSRRLFFRDILNPMISDIESANYTNEFHDIRFLEFNMSNICNLKCRMCNGIHSSAWVKEEIKLNDLNKIYLRPVNHPEFGYRKINETIIDRLFEFPEYFKNLKYLSIKGGEPYMEPANKKILSKLIHMGLSKNIILDLTTNGTLIDEELHSLALNFGHTKWTVSVEGTGDLYQYIRGDKNHTFENLNNNLVEYSKFDRVIIAVTVMAYNISHLEKIQTWYDQIKRPNYSIYFNNVVATPPYLNPRVLPNKILNKIQNKLPNINYSHDDSLSELLPVFVSFTKDLDNLRNTDIMQVCPELSELFE